MAFMALLTLHGACRQCIASLQDSLGYIDRNGGISDCGGGDLVRDSPSVRPPSDPRFVPAPRAAKLPDEISISPKGAPFKPFPQ